MGHVVRKKTQKKLSHTWQEKMEVDMERKYVDRKRVH